MKFLWSANDDPYQNLATEDALLDGDEAVLLLYVNRPCVVIGKHQNPWRECALEAMQADGVPLVRRLSGGGAVYHDPGNLNIAILSERATYTRDETTQLFIDVLAEFQIEARPNGPSSLFVGDHKISGQAFCYRRDMVLHHGTILLETDLERMGRYLKRQAGFTTHAVESVPARVANLGVAQADLVEAFRARTQAPIPAPPADPSPFTPWAWTHGKTPKFTLGAETVVKGCISASPDPARIGRRFAPPPSR